MSVGYQLLLLVFCLLVTGGNIFFATILGMLIYWCIDRYYWYKYAPSKKYKSEDDDEDAITY